MTKRDNCRISTQKRKYEQKLGENDQYAMQSRENESRFHYLCLDDLLSILKDGWQPSFDSLNLPQITKASLDGKEKSARFKKCTNKRFSKLFGVAESDKNEKKCLVGFTNVFGLGTMPQIFPPFLFLLFISLSFRGTRCWQQQQQQ